MVDDGPHRDDESEVDDDLDVFTGDPVDALFDVETSGEADDEDEVADASEQGHGDDAEFAVDVRIGEELPPELNPSPAEPPGVDDPFELDLLDPTDPGITSEDLRAFEDDVPPSSPGAGFAPPEERGADRLGDEEPEGPEGNDDDRYAWLYDEGVEPPPAVAERYGDVVPGDVAEIGSVDEPAAAKPEPDPPRPPSPGDDIDEATPLASSDESDGEPLSPLGTGDDIDEVASSDDDEEPEGPLPDWEGFTGEDYVAAASSTQEYQGLADELIRDSGPSEQMAVSAGIPGLETSIVGLDDVVGDDHQDVVVSEPRPDLGTRLVTGIGLLALFAVALLWSPALAVLATVIFALAAGELYAVLISHGHHPVAAFGLAGVAGCLIGTWVWGLVAVPVSLVATLVAVALFFATSSPRPSPLPDAALTVLVVAWMGGLGAFALPIITAADYRWLITAVVAIVAILDIGQYFVGRRFGSRPLAPIVSPKKTVEGLIGGAVAAFAVGVVFGFLGPFDLTSTLTLAAAAVVLGPFGDLAVSLVKRLLAVKDMGTVLPGHGGILDRIDALLFVIPAAWVVFNATGLLT